MFHIDYIKILQLNDDSRLTIVAGIGRQLRRGRGKGFCRFDSPKEKANRRPLYSWQAVIATC